MIARLISIYGVVKTALNIVRLINIVWIKYRVYQVEKHYEAKIIYLEENIKKLQNSEITDEERAEIARRLAGLGFPQ